MGWIYRFIIFKNQSHIVSRLQTNGYKLKDIYQEIREMGFNGSRSTACYNINILKEEYNISTSGFTQVQHPKIPYIKPLSSRELAKYIGACFKDITDHRERYYLQTLLDNIAELKIVRKLVQIFKAMLSRGHGNIKRWIDFIIRSKRNFMYTACTIIDFGKQ
jgi:transposase